MNPDPYQPPEVEEQTPEASPGAGAVLVAVVVAILAGGSLFLGTCFGTGLLLFEMSHGGLSDGVFMTVAFGGGGVLGVTAAFLAGRGVYRSAQRRAGDRAQVEHK